jgi:release factor glutamine methyltransferase
MDASLRERIAAARDALVRAGLQPSDAALDADVLARHALGWDRATLLSRLREAPPASFESAFDAFVARRAAREPVAMITGAREFWGLDFEVTPDVLVPRPETEFIVEEALSEYGRLRPERGAQPPSESERGCGPASTDKEPPGRVVDVGTGSGCLAVALAREFSLSRVVATDISSAALAVARRNAFRHGVADRLSFVRTSFLTGIGTDIDLIVSNPPYVPDSAAPALAPEVVRHEPHTALFGGHDGLSAIRAILATAAAHLSPSGRLIVEFGFGQEPDVAMLAAVSGWRVLRVREDLQGIPRTMVLGRWS